MATAASERDQARRLSDIRKLADKVALEMRDSVPPTGEVSVTGSTMLGWVRAIASIGNGVDQLAREEEAEARAMEIRSGTAPEFESTLQRQMAELDQEEEESVEAPWEGEGAVYVPLTEQIERNLQRASVPLRPDWQERGRRVFVTGVNFNGESTWVDRTGTVVGADSSYATVDLDPRGKQGGARVSFPWLSLRPLSTESGSQGVVATSKDGTIRMTQDGVDLLLAFFRVHPDYAKKCRAASGFDPRTQPADYLAYEIRQPNHAHLAPRARKGPVDAGFIDQWEREEILQQEPPGASTWAPDGNHRNQQVAYYRGFKLVTRQDTPGSTATWAVFRPSGGLLKRGSASSLLGARWAARAAAKDL